MHRHCLKIFLSILLITLLAISAGAETFSHDRLDSQARSYLELLDQGRHEEAARSYLVTYRLRPDALSLQNYQRALRSYNAQSATR